MEQPSEPRRLRSQAGPSSERQPPTMASRLGYLLRHEPLLQFALLAALLFALELSSPDTGPETIEVDRADIDALIAAREEVLQRPLDVEEREAVVAGFIDEEILVREATKRGLDQDGAVRRRLAENMMHLLADDPPAPSEQELRHFLEQHRERYRRPPALTLDHVHFENPAAVPAGLLDRLRAGAEFDAIGQSLGALGPTLPHYSRRDLALLGGQAFADAVFGLRNGRWQGPIESTEGLHFVRVRERHPPVDPPFEEIEPYLREDWIMSRVQAGVDAALAELRPAYRIVIDGREMADDPS